jgi:ATPase subunit of ABC transporter with duplicated ATPase domains
MILSVEISEKSFGNKNLIKDIKFSVDDGEKVGIIGGNGVGKSTLVKMLVDILKPDAGSVKWAEKAQLGYFAQDHEEDFAQD